VIVALRRDINALVDVVSRMAPPTSTDPRPSPPPTSQISAIRVGALFAAAAAVGITVTLVLALAMGAAPSADPVSAGTSLLPSSSGADDEISEGFPEP
jgi:hypothetical protein